MAKKKNSGLGRGLDALFGEIEEIEKTDIPAAEREGIDNVGIDDIKPNVNQPRKTFSPEGLEDLAASIREHGVIQPIIVRPSGKGYEIVAGERRWRAARIAGLKTVPCLVRDLSDRENMLFAIIENMYIFGRVTPHLSLVFSMVLRFIPKFRRQIAVVSKAQECIGREASSGSIVKRARRGMRAGITGRRLMSATSSP